MANLTIQGVVDLIREAIRETSDDSVFSDKYIYRIALESRAELMQQMLSNNKSFSPWFYQRFCLKTCPSSFIECGCETFDFACNVYRSTTPLPQPMWDESTLILNVSELWGDHINRITERQFRLLKDRKYKPKFYYYIGDYQSDKYLFLLSEQVSIPPKYIKVEGVFEDPLEALDFACQEDDCPSISGTGFPFTLSKEGALIQMAKQRIISTKKLPEDLSNNTNSTPNQAII